MKVPIESEIVLLEGRTYDWAQSDATRKETFKAIKQLSKQEFLDSYKKYYKKVYEPIRVETRTRQSHYYLVDIY